MLEIGPRFQIFLPIFCCTERKACHSVGQNSHVVFMSPVVVLKDALRVLVYE